jgi:hypothetical protein
MEKELAHNHQFSRYRVSAEWVQTCSPLRIVGHRPKTMGRKEREGQEEEERGGEERGGREGGRRRREREERRTINRRITRACSRRL